MDIYIVDTNVLFSAMISPTNDIARFILSRTKHDITFYAPKYLLGEIANHEPRIKEIARISEDEFQLVAQKIYREIIFVEDAIIPFEEWVNALRIVRDIDPDDAAFVALNNLMNETFWTGDMKLYNGLISKGYTRIVTFKQLKEKYNFV